LISGARNIEVTRPNSASRVAILILATPELTRPTHRLERDDFSSNRHPALSYSWSMMYSENRYPLFGIML
jgi:hypothetical protein